MSARGARSPRDAAFYDRRTTEVARALIGCELSHAGASGRIVETEAYHESEAACHAHIGLTDRTRVLLGPPGRVYVYRSYGIHALLNVVTEAEGIGAAVLIRALEPLDGVAIMRERRGRAGSGPLEGLCSGPGKLTQALGIDLEHNDGRLGDAIAITTGAGTREPRVLRGPRIGITKATELAWRFCDGGSRCVSRPLPPAMRAKPAGAV